MFCLRFRLFPAGFLLMCCNVGARVGSFARRQGRAGLQVLNGRIKKPYIGHRYPLIDCPGEAGCPLVSFPRLPSVGSFDRLQSGSRQVGSLARWLVVLAYQFRRTVCVQLVNCCPPTLKTIRKLYFRKINIRPGEDANRLKTRRACARPLQQAAKLAYLARVKVAALRVVV